MLTAFQSNIKEIKNAESVDLVTESVSIITALFFLYSAMLVNREACFIWALLGTQTKLLEPPVSAQQDHELKKVKILR